jgi:hypothetical protein
MYGASDTRDIEIHAPEYSSFDLKGANKKAESIKRQVLIKF